MGQPFWYTVELVSKNGGGIHVVRSIPLNTRWVVSLCTYLIDNEINKLGYNFDPFFFKIGS